MNHNAKSRNDNRAIYVQEGNNRGVIAYNRIMQLGLWYLWLHKILLTRK